MKNTDSATNEFLNEYRDLYETALSRIADEDDIEDKPGCARRMVEAYYRGRMDRERIEARMAVAA